MCKLKKQNGKWRKFKGLWRCQASFGESFILFLISNSVVALHFPLLSSFKAAVPKLLGTKDWFHGSNFSTDQGSGEVLGWFKYITFIVPLLIWLTGDRAQVITQAMGVTVNIDEALFACCFTPSASWTFLTSYWPVPVHDQGVGDPSLKLWLLICFPGPKCGISGGFWIQRNVYKIDIMQI